MLNIQNQLVLRGAIEVLSQASHILSQINNDQYRARLENDSRSSIGEHFRHLLDLFDAVIQALESGLVDYDRRSRGAPVERDRKVAISRCDSLVDIVSAMNDEVLDLKIELKTEVCLNECQSVMLHSSIQRELVFAAAHALHHFAIIREIACALGCQLSQEFGLAPATRSFLRSQPECAH